MNTTKLDATVRDIDVFDLEYSLSTIEIPDGVKEIGYGAFMDYTTLTTVKTPESVKVIGPFAFCYCKSLMNVILPSELIRIGEGAFKGCTSISDLTIPQGVSMIAACAFYDCTNLTNLHYAGTMAEWKAIEKRFDWNTNVPATKIICKDGNVPL